MTYVDNSSLDTGPLLFGRRTYEDFYNVWPKRSESPYSQILNNAQKYVVSTTLKEPLPWVNSTLINGNVPEKLRELKAQPGKNFLVMGSGGLVQTLIQAHLVDTYMLLVHPLVLGKGRKLFTESIPTFSLKLVNSKTTPTGVAILTYQSAENPRE
jgi:dihydrofolate reductase